MKKIMFNDSYGLTQAVIEGRKTMTRRLMNNQLGNLVGRIWFTKKGRDLIYVKFDFDNGISEVAPYAIGEVLAVAQCYNEVVREFTSLALVPGSTNKMFVKAELMPHRICITDIRAERLQDISGEECMREGIMYRESQRSFETSYTFHGSRYTYGSPRSAFASLIDKVSGRGTWESNPWVFVYEFEMVK